MMTHSIRLIVITICLSFIFQGCNEADVPTTLKITFMNSKTGNPVQGITVSLATSYSDAEKKNFISSEKTDNKGAVLFSNITEGIYYTYYSFTIGASFYKSIDEAIVEANTGNVYHVTLN